MDQVQSHNDYMRKVQTIHDQAQQNLISPAVCTTGMPNLIQKKKFPMIKLESHSAANNSSQANHPHH